MRSMTRSRRCGLPAVLLTALAMPAAPARADWTAEAEAGAAYESNIGRGQLDSDIRSDTALTLAASAGTFFMPGDRGGLFLSADLSAASNLHYHGLSHLDLGLSAAYKYKFDVGPEAPWLRARGSVTRLNYQNSVRNGWLYAAGVGAGRRIGERWDLRADYGYERRSADENVAVAPEFSGAAFAQRNRVFSANADYSWSEDTAFLFGYTRRQGDVTPTTQRNFTIFSASTAITADPVFGTDWFAYRLTATTHLVFVGVSRALSPRSSLNFGFERQVSHAEGGNDYTNNLSRISFAQTF
jgi:Outer membrane protein beta-barrel domain